MSQKSDDSIERFFRKAVVQQDKTFMERDWQRMEKMLDAQTVLPVAQHAGKVRAIIKTAALTIVVASLFIIGTETQTDSGIVQKQAAVGTVGPHVEVKTGNPTADLHSSDATCNDKSEKPAGTIVYATQHGPKKTQQSIPSGKQITHVNDKSPEQYSKSVQPIFPVGEKKSDDDDHAGLNESIAIKDVARPEKSTSGPALGNTPDEQAIETVKADSVAKSEDAKDELPQAPETEDDETEVRVPKFIITGLISPDFSTTSLTKYSKPSGVFGVLVGYRILKRFTVMTGVTKGLKKYEGYGDEYSPPEGYWQYKTNGVVPDEVEGKCGIVEVPIMLQFDILQRPTSRVFLSGGVSSYFMRSENYQYTFNEPNPGAANSWTAKKPSQYLFRVGHFSAGYDRMIGKNFSVGIEPFLKVPFEGIGWTNINLYSTGAYINLRYTILRTQQ